MSYYVTIDIFVVTGAIALLLANAIGYFLETLLKPEEGGFFSFSLGWVGVFIKVFIGILVAALFTYGFLGTHNLYIGALLALYGFFLILFPLKDKYYPERRFFPVRGCIQLLGGIATVILTLRPDLMTLN